MVIWMDPSLQELDTAEAVPEPGRHWHRSPAIAAGPGTAKARRLDARAARMRIKYFLHGGKGCKTGFLLRARPLPRTPDGRRWKSRKEKP